MDLKKSEDNMTALHLAALNNHTDILKLLFSIDRVDPNAKCWNNQTPLHIAVCRLNYEACEAIVTLDSQSRSFNRSIDVNIQDLDGHTPLHCLMLAYSIATVKKGCKNGTNEVNI